MTTYFPTRLFLVRANTYPKELNLHVDPIISLETISTYFCLGESLGVPSKVGRVEHFESYLGFTYKFKRISKPYLIPPLVSPQL